MFEFVCNKPQDDSSYDYPIPRSVQLNDVLAGQKFYETAYINSYPLSVTARPGKSSYNLYEPILIDVNIKNCGKQTISLNNVFETGDNQLFQIENTVESPDDFEHYTEPVLTTYPSAMFIPGETILTMQPGDSISFYMDIVKELTNPGTYKFRTVFLNATAFKNQPTLKQFAWRSNKVSLHLIDSKTDKE